MQLLILVLLLLAVPTVIGGIAVSADPNGGGLLFRWVSGHFFLWAGFQLLCVPLILLRRSFSDMVLLFLAYMAVLTVLSVAMGIRRGKRSGSERNREGLLLWAIFWGLLLFQFVQAVRLAFDDSDDAYYVAAAVIAESSDTMYQINPYTGGATMLDDRHGLAPFPIWIAFLARLSGMRTVVLAQVALPVVLIAIAYGIYCLFGRELFPGKGGQLPLFLIFTEILVLFGNCSVYTAETFLIGRSRQGKAGLAGIVIPFTLYLLLMLLRKLRERERVPAMLYLLIGAASLAGCLCSTLGTLLICMVVGIAGLMGAVRYKRPGVLFPLAACCVPCVAYAIAYLV